MGDETRPEQEQMVEDRVLAARHRRDWRTRVAIPDKDILQRSLLPVPAAGPRA